MLGESTNATSEQFDQVNNTKEDEVAVDNVVSNTKVLPYCNYE